MFIRRNVPLTMEQILEIADLIGQKKVELNRSIEDANKLSDEYLKPSRRTEIVQRMEQKIEKLSAITEALAKA